MAKKIITPEIEAKLALEKILSGSSSIYYNVNGILLSRTAIDRVLMVVPDKPLLTVLLSNEEINIEEMDSNHEYYKYLHGLFKYGENLDSEDWIELDSEILYSGEIIKIKLKDHKHPVEITKVLLPVKLKKAEYVNIYYRVIVEDSATIVILRKDFKSFNEGYSYSTLTPFRLI